MKRKLKGRGDGTAVPRPSLVYRARSWYGRFERPLSSLSLISGFIFDALTLRRVDIWLDNFWVIAHLVIVTVCAVWINLLDNAPSAAGVRPEADPGRLHFWLVNVMQFFFGGILSVYLVFYFRSGTFATSWPFLFILALAFIANESLKRRFARLSFQIALLFLAYYSFAIYLMPILLHEISTRVFILSGVVSVGAVGILLLVFGIFSRERFAGRMKWAVLAAIVSVLIIVNGLYFANLIPPLPLSLQSADIYHALIVHSPGNYTALDEDQPATGIASIDFLARFFTLGQTVHIVKGDSLTAYTAIFSPTALNTNIIHEWQYYNATSSTWITRGRITLGVTGGSDNGYRTFSIEPNVAAGQWRVNVETPGGQVIGRLNFTVVVQAFEPELIQTPIGAAAST